MKIFVKKITWLRGINTGWGNGYVVIPKGHPLHGKSYDDINVDVHGGLTFASSANDLEWNEITKKDKEGWIVGFDTAHGEDNLSKWPKKSVERETKRLEKQLMQYK